MRYFLAFLIISASCPVLSWANLQTDADLILQKYYSQAQFIGSVRIIRHAQVIYDRSLGFAQPNTGIKNSATTVYRIESLTKQFTAMLILQLQEQGQLSVSDSIYDYLPSFPKKKYDITIAHLITHTSGVPDYTQLPGFWENAYKPVSKKDLVNRFAQLPLEFVPGTQAKYSNSGFVLLGLIIEAKTHMAFEQVIQKMIFNRLDMQKSGYETTFQQIPFRAFGYLSNGSTTFPVPPMDMSNAAAAGALYSNMNDMTSWVLALTRPVLVTTETLQSMLTPVQKVTGFGWAFDQRFGLLEAFHNGGGPRHGFHNRITYFPGQDFVIIILSNLGNAPVEVISSELSKVVLEN
jgi:CubicO group peptidase (beta-lactamase class C family)